MFRIKDTSLFREHLFQSHNSMKFVICTSVNVENYCMPKNAFRGKLVKLFAHKSFFLGTNTEYAV